MEIGRMNHDIISTFGEEGFWAFYKAACTKAHRPITLCLYTSENKVKTASVLQPVDNISNKSVLNKVKNSAKSKENDFSLSVDEMPTCKSIFKTPMLTKKNFPLKKKISGELLQPPDVPEKKSKELEVEVVRNMQSHVAVEVPIADLTFTETVLGKGAFGEVRKGVWSYSNVAIKTINVLDENPKDILKEVLILRTVLHPNIVLIMGYAIQKYHFHIVMEFIDGYTLMDLIFKETVKSKFPLTICEKMKITNQILIGLAFLHGFPNQIIHRDIKPPNIMLIKEKLVKICDLGVSKISEADSELMTTN
ncbi:hypothetical protein TKK_0003470 [Trichogramma kaykai]|uniref:Protein kinase domain-containing protein n=1 Tax=Trichogramma kaykai TaxID=54128 RepID=A0ABD2XQK0_9HYME